MPCLVACLVVRTGSASASEFDSRREPVTHVLESTLKDDSPPHSMGATRAFSLTNEISEKTHSSSEPAAEESLFSTDYLKTLIADTKFVLTSPARWEKKDWFALSLAAAGVAAVSLLDKAVWEEMQRNKSKTADDIADIAAKVGGVYSLGITASLYVVGEVLDNSKAKSVALDAFAASMIAAGIISPAIKFAVGRSAPRDDEGTSHFRPFSVGHPFSGEGQSFSSGHAAQSFSLASVIAAHYDELWVKVTAYSIASVLVWPECTKVHISSRIGRRERSSGRRWAIRSFILMKRDARKKGKRDSSLFQFRFLVVLV